MNENIEYLIVFIVGLVLGICLYRLIKRAKRLQAEREGLWRQVDRLRKELNKYTGAKTKIALTLPEKRIVLSALEGPTYKDKITNPKTKRLIRDIYNTLKGKVKYSIKQERMGIYG